MSKEAGLTRREFIVDSVLATVGLTLLSTLPTGCSPELRSETSRRWERGEEPEAGDIIFLANKPYLLRNNKKYPIPDIDRFVEYTKFVKYGGRVFKNINRDNFESIPLGEVGTEPYVFDPYTGLPKTNKMFGGEMNVYFAGVLTSGGNVHSTTRPINDTFVEVTSDLKPNGWDVALDSSYFLYGRRALDNESIEYPSEDTARSPVENIKHALDFFATLKEEFPLVQFNLIAHSLGGLFALACAMEHWDAINNLILINSPVRGFSGTDDCQRKGAWLLKQWLKLGIEIGRVKLGLRIDEKVTDFLFSLGNNKTYQKEIEDFAGFMGEIGKRLIIIYTDGDRIVRPESAIIENAELLRLEGPTLEDDCPVSIFPPHVDIPTLLEIGRRHGAPLKNPAVRSHIKEAFGKNLAKTA